MMQLISPRQSARVVRAGFTLGLVTVTVAGCQFGGLNSLTMPGAAGHGSGAFSVTIDLPDVATLPQNSPVMVDDVTVGSIAGVKARQRPDGTFYAAVTLALQPNVKLPANTTVKVAQTSLLGSQHIELAAPSDEPSRGRLTDGSHIPIQQSSRYPTTEEVLSSLGLVANKGNLAALQDITDEAYNAVAGRAGQFTDLIPRLAQFTAAVDQQTQDIVTAIDKIDGVAKIFADNKDKLSAALDALPAALRALNDNGANIVTAFSALQRLGTVAADVLARIKTDFPADLKDAYAVIKPVADHASELVDALPFLPAFPIPIPGTKNAVKGDFLNAFVTLDLTVRRFGENVFTTSALDPNMKHMAEILNPPDFLIGEQANLSGQAADPFQTPPSPSNGPR